MYTFPDCPRSSLQDDVMLSWVQSWVIEYQWVFQNNAKSTSPKLEVHVSADVCNLCMAMSIVMHVLVNDYISYEKLKGVLSTSYLRPHVMGSLIVLMCLSGHAAHHRAESILCHRILTYT